MYSNVLTMIIYTCVMEAEIEADATRRTILDVDLLYCAQCALFEYECRNHPQPLE